MKLSTFFRFWLVLFVLFVYAPVGFAQPNKNPVNLVKSGEKGVSETYRAAEDAAGEVYRAVEEAAGESYRAAERATQELRELDRATSVSSQRITDIEMRLKAEIAHEERRVKKIARGTSPEQQIANWIPKTSSTPSKDIFIALNKVWALEDRIGNHNLFSSFIQKYYSQNFGIVSPHLQKLFNKVTSLHDRNLQMLVTRRVHYLAMNKQLLSLAALPEVTTQLSSKAFRIRYTADIGQLTAKNFQPSRMVLSIERHMSPDPQKDFPLHHVSGHAMFTIGQQTYPVYQFNGPLENIDMLYRFLLNGNKKKQPLTVVFDEKNKSMAIYSQDRSRWLRISSHEYSVPERLHLHLNEARVVTFTNCYGVEKTEQVNFNLSIPLAVPENLPSHNVQDFLYKQLIENPIKMFKGNDNITIEKRPIF